MIFINRCPGSISRLNKEGMIARRCGMPKHGIKGSLICRKFSELIKYYTISYAPLCKEDFVSWKPTRGPDLNISG